MTTKCHECGGKRFTESEHESVLIVGGRRYRSKWAADKCNKCGDVSFDGLQQRAFMRKALGVPATELADLLDVTRETVSRWERGHQPLDRRAAVILGDLVGDSIEGRTRTLDRLRALREPPKLAKTVPIELDAQIRKAAAR